MIDFGAASRFFPIPEASVHTQPFLLLTTEPSRFHAQADARAFSRFQPECLTDYRVLFVENGPEAYEALQRIRRHGLLEIYLFPVVVKAAPSETIDDILMELSDGVVVNDDLDAFFHGNRRIIDHIHRCVEEFKLGETGTQPGQADPAIRVIRFMHSRNRPLKPVVTTRSVLGYVYPFLNAQRIGDDSGEIDILSFLENRFLVSGRFVDRIHSCNFCYSSFLNFREICVKCDSPDLNMQDLIHHYVCGYVGPESDFRNAEARICPKCRKALQHIGVDYERPGILFTCNRCGQKFQEPGVDILCLNCRKRTTPENAVVRIVQEYDLTALGRSSAAMGVVVSVRDALVDSLDILELPVFTLVLNLEIERIRRYRLSRSTLVRFAIDNFGDIFVGMGRRAQDIVDEISHEIKAVLRKTDSISYLSDSMLVFLMAETSAEQAKIAVGRLKQRIAELLRSNLEMDIHISFTCRPLDGGLTAKELLEQVASCG